MNILTKTSSKDFNWNGRNGVAVASDLGLRAGEWPNTLLVESTRTGDSLHFEKNSEDVVEGDLLSVEYLAVSGGLFVHLTIFND